MFDTKTIVKGSLAVVTIAAAVSWFITVQPGQRFPQDSHSALLERLEQESKKTTGQLWFKERS